LIVFCRCFFCTKFTRMEFQRDDNEVDALLGAYDTNLAGVKQGGDEQAQRNIFEAMLDKAYDPNNKTEVIYDLGSYKYTPGRKPVLVFGSSKVGKSTIINLLSMTDWLKTDGLTSKGCTLDTSIMANVSNSGQVFDIIDTAGLNESSGDAEGRAGVTSAAALKNILTIAEFLHEGISLAIYVRKKGAITNLDVTNTALFHKALAENKVPLIVVETGHDGVDGDGLKLFSNTNRADTCAALGAKDLVAVCTRPQKEVSDRLKDYYQNVCSESFKLIWDSVHKFAMPDPVKITDGKGWITGWDCFCVATGIPLRSSGYKDIGSLMKQAGVSRDDAEKIIQRFVHKDITKLFESMRTWAPPSWIEPIFTRIVNAFVSRFQVVN